MRYSTSHVIRIALGATAFVLCLILWMSLKSVAAVRTTVGETAAAVRQLQNDVAKGLATRPTATGDAMSDTFGDVTLRTMAQAREAAAKAGKSDDILETATALADLDTWDVAPGDEQAFLKLKLDLAAKLRARVKARVIALQQQALSSPNGATAAARHVDAGEALALYPMAQDRTVLDEARQLSNRQADVATRIEVVRRQRYNLWAAQQIEWAMGEFNAKQSYWSPKKENALLIDIMVKYLGPIDPVILEPTVLELYNYIVQRTKENISEPDKTSLAKRLSDPALVRQTLGDH